MAHLNVSDADNVLQPTISIKTMINTSSPLHDKAVLHELYVEKRLSQREIATLLASSKSTIQGALNRFGIKTRPKGTNPKHTIYNLPYGKKIYGGKLVNNRPEMLVIAKMQHLHAQGMSYNAIAKHLTAEGIPTKKQGKGWNDKTIKKILIRESKNKKGAL